MHTILKLSYFLVFILLLSCGDKTNRQIKNKTTEIVSEPQETPVNTNSKVILFFGNSLTAGMGLDPEEAFPAVIQSKLDSLRLDYQVVNAGLSGETTASGKNRLNWVLKQKVDIFVLELGANDGLR
ncbi:MAG: GDSL-type esterase/lipase family protein, partial [Maribacter sp.]